MVRVAVEATTLQGRPAGIGHFTAALLAYEGLPAPVKTAHSLVLVGQMGWQDSRILRLTSDAHLREQLRSAGRARAARYSWQWAGAQMLEIVREAAGRT